MPLDPKSAATALRGPPSPAMDALFSHKFPPPKGKEDKKDKGMRTIHFVRHGAAELNNDDVSVDRMRGWKDIPLSPDGKEEANKLGDKMKADPPDHVLTSDLKRAHDTAKVISEKTGAPLSESTKEFRPWNVGDLAGTSTKDGIPVLAKYAEHKPEEPVPGGESFNDFRDRFFSGLHGALDKYDGEPAIVAHHRNERLLHGWAKAGHPEDGSIDMGEFNKKGEHTGAVTKMDIPMGKLRALAARPPKGKSNGKKEE